ncbi:MAG: chemotaxis protein CheW [Phycisphaerales bacterium]|nr:chemotaxis protein CheW [Phycisphaerales bacterium]
MTDNKSTEQSESIRNLAKAAEQLAADDLTTLAQMHGWASTLGDADAESKAQLVELSGALEGLIIGTVEDTQQALDRVVAIIGELAGDVDGVVGRDAGAQSAMEESADGDAMELLGAVTESDASDAACAEDVEDVMQAPDAEASVDAEPVEAAVEIESTPDVEVSTPQLDARTADDDAEPVAEVDDVAVDESAAEAPVLMSTYVDPRVERLMDAAKRVDATDMTLLAAMHTDLEVFSEESDGDTRGSQLAELVESIIMATVDDPDAAIEQLRAGIAALNEPPGEAPLDLGSSTASATNDAESVSDGDIESQLDKVFGDDDSPEPEAVAEAPKAKPAAPAPVAASSDAPVQASYVPEPLLIDTKEIEFVVAFIEEAAEHIENIEAALLEVEQSPDDSEKINELFRPFHTIKGMAGFLNLRDVNCLTHEVETLLDQGRRGERTITSGITDLVFEVIDILKAQIGSISAYASAPTGGAIPQPPVAEMIDRLRGVVAGRINPDAAENKSQRRGGKASAEQPAQPAAQASSDASSAPAAPQPAKSGTSAPQPPKAVAAVEQSVRIDTEKLDALVDMVGELVIAQTLITSSSAISGDPLLSKNAAQVSKIVRDVQEAAMAMRMIPVKSTFQKMARLVRDLSRKAGKQVELAISGEETELDKNVIQQIGDPLVHMVRNAVDHGLEPPDERTAAGKSPTGHIQLNAFHHSGNIVIEIRDDGRGLDPEKLKRKALEKGLIQPDDELTDEQAYQLIFAPGFSTAAQITDISGRGVGMDVVRRNIEQLRGRVEITSEKGRGSRFSIQLPLTLAIIDGMLVRVGTERFIIPTTMIEQALRPKPEQLSTVQKRGELLNVRGKLVPLIQLGQLFNFTGRVRPSDAMVVTAHTDDGDIGLVVDELVGQQQVVIKSLGERFQGLRGLAGAAILGDGRVGLILDPSGVRTAHGQWEGAGIQCEASRHASDGATDETEWSGTADMSMRSAESGATATVEA